MAQNQEGYTIFVRNIPYSTDGKELAQAFIQFGEIAQSHIATKQLRGKSTSLGYGFVTFKTQEAYNKAINNKTPIKITGNNGERILEVSPKRGTNNNHNHTNNNSKNNTNDNNNNNNDDDNNSHHRFPRERGFRGRERGGFRGRAPRSTQYKDDSIEDKNNIIHGSCEIFVGDVPANASKEDVMNSLVRYNPINIVEFGEFYGGKFAIVKLKSNEDSMNAIKQKVSVNGANCRVLLARYNQRKRHHGIRRAPHEKCD